MAQIRKDWIINGVLLAGILCLVVLTMLQKMNSESPLEAGSSSGAQLADSASTITLTADRAAPTAMPILETESQYNLKEIPSPASLKEVSGAYPNLAKLDVNIFRPLITPLPKTPTPTPTAAPTPSLEKAVENWQLWNPRRRPGKATAWVFKDKKNETAKIEVTVGQPFTLNDPEVGEFEAIIKDAGRSAVTIQYKDQEKTFSLR